MVGALYSLSVSALGLANGPTCLYVIDGFIPLPVWGTPFKDNNGSYLGDRESWERCLEPKDVVEFNVILFSVLLVASLLELVLCGFQMVNGLFGCLCGTCGGKEVRRRPIPCSANFWPAFTKPSHNVLHAA
ncbi:hypothetical protein SKAU_G00371990 [Synaphobranchus kaupii]|uniref:Transmembrane 4 L6 family member 1 n=1 Tax=Synaphobranchus kaupii TaxID=118154 RepID=A0A9Q1IDX8_SYNKA|nr:hypothetical protein SKAU_G00371990 [Synaphobranchus kaupii]